MKHRIASKPQIFSKISTMATVVVILVWALKKWSVHYSEWRSHVTVTIKCVNLSMCQTIRLCSRLIISAQNQFFNQTNVFICVDRPLPPTSKLPFDGTVSVNLLQQLCQTWQCPWLIRKFRNQSFSTVTFLLPQPFYSDSIFCWEYHIVLSCLL